MADSDGTQAPEPPKPFTDSLSSSTSGRESPSVEVPKPATVDRDAVAKLVDVAPPAERRAADSLFAADADDEPTAEIPPQQPAPQPGGRALLLQPVLRLRGLPGPTAPRSKRAVTVRKPSSGSAGLAVALVLLVIFIVIAIQFVASFVESVTGIFS